ncbi:hypothetical protein [Kutzneria kofuensis]|uniref:hypothetical protein n=1 Tax=Kutzneria kofuensis TaxID=103725 RepID=UPI0031F158F8
MLPSASEELRNYLECLSRLLRGNMEWGLQAQRYRNPDGRSPDAVRTRGFVDGGTAGSCRRRAAIPSIAWWWDPELGL